MCWKRTATTHADASSRCMHADASSAFDAQQVADRYQADRLMRTRPRSAARGPQRYPVRWPGRDPSGPAPVQAQAHAPDQAPARVHRPSAGRHGRGAGVTSAPPSGSIPTPSSATGTCSSTSSCRAESRIVAPGEWRAALLSTLTRTWTTRRRSTSTRSSPSGSSICTSCRLPAARKPARVARRARPSRSGRRRAGP